MTMFDERLARGIAAHDITGASFAYWDGETLHTTVAGKRNSATGDPVTEDTVMHIGSITKVLNTALLMQLVDEGKVALADSVTTYLPELRLRDRKALKRITCEMLVNHTSGIDGDWLPEYGPDQERIIDAVERCGSLGQLFPPGTATSYCNIATVIAGHLVQKLRDRSWYTLVEDRVYGPLDMREALADVSDSPRFRCSIGDLTNPLTGEMVQTTRPFLSPSFAPAGSTLMMSARDLVKFARALLNGGVGLNGARIVSAGSALRMTKATAAFVAPAQQVGLGWMILPGNVLTHFGGGPGVSSRLLAHPASGRVMVLLTNSDRGETLWPAIVEPIVTSWTGHSHHPSLAPSKVVIDQKVYQGVYESNLQTIAVIPYEDGLALRWTMKIKLYDNSPVSTESDRVAKLTPLGDHSFKVQPFLPGASGMDIKFVQPDANGSMRFLAAGARLLRRRREMERDCP